MAQETAFKTKLPMQVKIVSRNFLKAIKSLDKGLKGGYQRFEEEDLQVKRLLGKQCTARIMFENKEVQTLSREFIRHTAETKPLREEEEPQAEKSTKPRRMPLRAVLVMQGLFKFSMPRKNCYNLKRKRKNALKKKNGDCVRLRIRADISGTDSEAASERSSSSADICRIIDDINSFASKLVDNVDEDLQPNWRELRKNLLEIRCYYIKKFKNGLPNLELKQLESTTNITKQQQLNSCREQEHKIADWDRNLYKIACRLHQGMLARKQSQDNMLTVKRLHEHIDQKLKQFELDIKQSKKLLFEQAVFTDSC